MCCDFRRHNRFRGDFWRFIDFVAFSAIYRLLGDFRRRNRIHGNFRQSDRSISRRFSANYRKRGDFRRRGQFRDMFGDVIDFR